MCGGNMEYLTVHEISKKWNMNERRVTALCRDNRIAGIRKEGNTWLIPSDSLMPLDMRTKEYENIVKMYNDKGVSYSSGGERVIDFFRKKYKKDPMYTTFTPYRICPIGAHVDHNLGKITGFAIDRGVHIAYSIKNNGVIELESLQFPKRAQWHVLATPEVRENDWADHLRGATIALAKRFNLKYGLSAIIDGELPIGGLSSSAAVIITFINALANLNNIEITPSLLIDISIEAENNYVGVSSGKLDQCCEIYSKKNKLLFMDMKDSNYELVDTPKNMKPYVIGIFFSGLENSLESYKYNMRIDEARCAAYNLLAFSGMNYSKFNDTNLRDVPYDIYLKYKNKLPDNFRKRAEHFYTEMDRVEKGIIAWRNGNIEEFGKLINESGESTINNWETVSDELIKLYEILKNTKGVYGTRFSGSGFKGCCIAFINPEYVDLVFENTSKLYLDMYPHLKNKYSAHICHSADGVKL